MKTAVVTSDVAPAVARLPDSDQVPRKRQREARV